MEEIVLHGWPALLLGEGYASAADVIGPARDMLPQAVATALTKDRVQALIDGAGGFVPLAQRSIHAGGISILATLAVMFSARGDTLSWRVTMRDARVRYYGGARTLTCASLAAMTDLVGMLVAVAGETTHDEYRMMSPDQAGART